MSTTAMEELKDKMVSLDVKEDADVKIEQKEDEDSDGSFHSAASDDEAPMDTESSLTESSEDHPIPNVIKPDDDYDTDDEASWLPAEQHTPKPTRIKRRKERKRFGKCSDSENSDKDAPKPRRGSTDHIKEGNADKKEDSIHTTPKEEEDEENEDEYIDEEHLKDLEVTMTEEYRKKQQELSLKHKESGNNNFKCGRYKEAILDYTAGLRTCPLSLPKDRAILYGNRAAAMAKMDRKKDAIRDCSRAVELDEEYTKVILRRATLREEDDQLDEALKDYQKVLELDPSCHNARMAIHRLPPMIEQRNEKLKEEMMGKLKDLGNMILRPFGLSTSNFEMKQDPNSGGYNINFKQNPNS